MFAFLRETKRTDCDNLCACVCVQTEMILQLCAFDLNYAENEAMSASRRNQARNLRIHIFVKIRRYRFVVFFCVAFCVNVMLLAHAISSK